MNILQGMYLLAAANVNATDPYLKSVLNTILAIGIGFIVLITILFIIIIRYISKLANSFSNQNSNNNIFNLNSVSEYNQSVSAQEISLTDNAELVAVITAAIMASMGDEAPEDGLVVRSIRRKRMQNA